MILQKFIFTLFLLIISQVLSIDLEAKSDVESTEVVPVLIWQSEQGKNWKYEGEESFENFITKIVSPRKLPIILFFEQNLSSEDFVLAESSDTKSFSKLEKIITTSSYNKFLPSVHKPIKSIKNIGYKYTDYKKGTLKLEDSTVYLVSLDDAFEFESRPEMLEKHSNLISDLYGNLAKSNENIIGIYTSKYASWRPTEIHHRVRRLLEVEANDSNKGQFYFDKDKNAMLYTLDSPVLNISGSPPIVLNKATVTTFDDVKQMQRLIITFSDPKKVTLRFRFSILNSGYWKFGEVEVALPNSTEVILSAPSKTMPKKFSYHCSAHPTIFKNGDITLSLKNFQIQTDLNGGKFNDAYDCVYFFTIPILSGIFVTTLLACILAWGLCMILDIKTMDRFDDPKGKTLTFNVSE